VLNAIKWAGLNECVKYLNKNVENCFLSNGLQRWLFQLYWSWLDLEAKRFHYTLPLQNSMMKFNSFIYKRTPVNDNWANV
jgi:hypothetical protein